MSASAVFLSTHFGFTVEMSNSDFAKLARPDAGADVVFVRCGIEVLPESYRDQQVAGFILAFTTTGLEDEERRLRGEGVEITLPLREEPWGERLFQVTDPSGMIIQLVEWVASP
ncbi:hypothetical protein PX52LOC_04730 [Limnoglobus roseus]|uniref:VOC domain-containing protein n=1 Tax=Limnoglobus roseus TaxID=2598579 RepID=A0A5C1AFY2_9BACT|nr:hypothetical protein PX52LOC_04730 [Limnoglobus roseus]